jgi:hypothetical protein
LFWHSKPDCDIFAAFAVLRIFVSIEIAVDFAPISALLN